MTFKTVSNAQIKHIRLLQQKKYRQRYRQFIVEGTKSVLEFVQSRLKCHFLVATTDWLAENNPLVYGADVLEAKDKQLTQITSLKHHQQVIGVFEMEASGAVDNQQSIILALEEIRDPGNLGTIIRTADWFGLTQIVCSPQCADCYNQKVVQASMGSLSRVRVVYQDLVPLINSLPNHQLTLADMEGIPVKEFDWQQHIIVIGTEGKGISKEIESLSHQKITIPAKGKAESLNAAISAGIILNESLG